MPSSWSSFAVPFALCALVAIAPSGAARALKAPVQLGTLEEADRKALETIASHDAPLRDAVLEASLHIDALVETQRIQEQSSASFQERIGKLDKKQQEQMWEIVREPGLLDELATEDRPSRSQLDEIAARHPDSLAPAIRTFGADHHDMLVDVAQIHRRANERFDAALSDLDKDTQQAFRDLVDQPELLSVLVRRVNLVVRLGDSYRKNPKDTRSYLTALAADVEKRSAADREEWKRRIENDPKAAEELDEAARDYADESGYDYDELTNPEVRTSVAVVVNPYPYWFGYPVWYADAYLYPYGYWYPYPAYFGYYHYHDHFVWYGLPSLAFMNWFYFGHHHHHYSYLSHCFSNYYHGRPWAPTHYNTTVNNLITRSDRIDRRRPDGSFSRGDASRGDVHKASYADGDRGFFFNRYRGQDAKERIGNRSAPGERGPAMDSERGKLERTKGVRGAGEGRANTRSRDAVGTRSAPRSVTESVQKDRGAARGRSVEQPSRAQGQANFFERSDPKAQREAAPAEPRGRREREWSHAPREWPHSPKVIREGSRDEQPAPSGGGERRSGGGERRGGQRGGGGDAPAAQGADEGGGGQRFGGGDAPSYRGDHGSDRVYGGDGGYRGRSSGGSSSGGRSWGGSRGDFGGGGYGGGFGGGGFGGGRGGYGGGGRGR